jgi:hypothetical protein
MATARQARPPSPLSGVFLDEFLGCVDSRSNALAGLLHNSGRNALHPLGDRFRLSRDSFRYALLTGRASPARGLPLSGLLACSSSLPC